MQISLNPVPQGAQPIRLKESGQDGRQREVQSCASAGWTSSQQGAGLWEEHRRGTLCPGGQEAGEGTTWEKELTLREGHLPCSEGEGQIASSLQKETLRKRSAEELRCFQERVRYLSSSGPGTSCRNNCILCCLGGLKSPSHYFPPFNVSLGNDDAVRLTLATAVE